MNNIILLQIISLVGIFIIAIIVVYQFVQEQQALNKLDEALKQEEMNIQNYDTYSECYQYWTKSAVGDDTTKETTAGIMCEEYLK